MFAVVFIPILLLFATLNVKDCQKKNSNCISIIKRKKDRRYRKDTGSGNPARRCRFIYQYFECDFSKKYSNMDEQVCEVGKKVYPLSVKCVNLGSNQ